MSLDVFGDEGNVGPGHPDDVHRCPVCDEPCWCADFMEGKPCACADSHPPECAHDFGMLGICVKCGETERLKAGGA
jgi:hypothetical protein